MATATLRRLVLQVRRALFPPGSRAEQFYFRHLRRFARPLRHTPAPAHATGVTAWPSPARAPGTLARIAVLKLDHIGDFLIAAPAFALLRRGFPAAHITLICGPWNHALAKASGWFDTIASLAFFDETAEGTAQRFDAAAIAALGRFDLAIDLRVDEDTRPVLAALSSRLKLGYAAPGIATLTLALPTPPIPPARADLTQHRRAQLLALIAAAQSLDPLADTQALLARATAPYPTAWPRPILAVAPGSGRAIKNWPLPNFIAVLRRFQAERGGTVVLLGGPREQQDAHTIAASLNPAATVDLTARIPLAQSFAILAAADLFLGNDSALGHAAAALSKPTLVIVSGIDPLPNWIPLGPHATALKAEIACAPCHLSDLALCPNAHRCLTAITPEQVWQALPIPPPPSHSPPA